MRSRNSLMRERREAFRDARLIVIASEGKDTERIYFKALAKEYTNPRVHVHILERSVDEQNNSSPEHVLKQLNDYKSQYELEADDELWLVVDKDRWTEAMISRVATECLQEVAMHMALSNPCFEIWLLLHVKDQKSSISSDAVINELKRSVHVWKSYSKSTFTETQKAFLNLNTEVAIARAKELPEFENPSTGVYKLIEMLKKDVR